MDLNARLKSIENYMKLLTEKVNELVDAFNDLNSGKVVEPIDPTDPNE